MREFYDIINGLKKNGTNLDEDELYCIRGVISKWQPKNDPLWQPKIDPPIG